MSNKIITIVPGTYIISVVIFFNFIIPQVLIPRSLLILIFTIIPAIYLFLKNKFEITSFLLILFIAIITLISPDISKLLNVYYIILFLVLARAYKGVIRISLFNNKILLIATISIILQILYFAIHHDDSLERMGLGTDANFSGLLVILLFFFLKKANRIYSYIPLILGILIFRSRALLLSTIVFIIIKRLRSIGIFNNFFKKITRPLSIIILTNLLFLILNTVYIQKQIFSKNEAPNAISRLTNINDSAIWGRLIANQMWSLEILTGKYFLKSENNEDEAFGDELIPHNSIIYLFVTSSVVFSFIYLVFLSYLLSPLLKGRNYEYFFSYLSFSLFLHGLYSSIFLFPFMLVLLINNK